MKYNKSELYFFTALFLGVLALLWFIVLPHIPALMLAAVTAVLMYPLYERISKMLKSPSGAAAITVLIVLVSILIPLSIIAGLLFNEARDLSVRLSNGGGLNGAAHLLDPIEQYVQTVLPDFSFELGSVTKEVLNWVAGHLGTAFTGTAQAFLALIIWLISLFYFLKDGPKFVKTFVNFSPLSDRYDHLVLDKLQNTIHSVLQGSLAIALIQGTLTGIGFAIFGIPSAVLWGSFAAICALIPGIGTGLVITPAVLYLFFVGATPQAVGLAIWGVIAVGMIDNFLMPKFLGSRAQLHPLFVLVSVLGGLAFFGASGFILGPLVLSLLYALGEIYVVIFKNEIKHAAKES